MVIGSSGGQDTVGTFHYYSHMATSVILKLVMENTTSKAAGTADSPLAAGDLRQRSNETSELLLSEDWIPLCTVLGCAAALADHDVKFH